MSNFARNLEFDCPATAGCGALQTVLMPRDRDLGGFAVRRLLPTARRQMVGPWIFFDHMGPADFPAGQGINVRPHPHVNLATVTYLFEGEMLHRDSLGSEQLIRPGDINLMVAGRGIVHSERERPEVKARAHRQHGLQLWLALPAADEETDPAFHHYPAGEIPAAEVDGVALRVMMGRAYGLESPVKTYAETVYVEATLAPGQRLELPAAAERAVYVVHGALQALDTAIPEHAMAIFDATPGVTVKATAPTRLAIIGGEPLGRRHIDWNFVSSRRERIDQAREDWKQQRFRTIPGDSDEYIALPE